jgi:hypothetical protein
MESKRTHFISLSTDCVSIFGKNYRRGEKKAKTRHRMLKASTGKCYTLGMQDMWCMQGGRDPLHSNCENCMAP